MLQQQALSVQLCRTVYGMWRGLLLSHANLEMGSRGHSLSCRSPSAEMVVATEPACGISSQVAPAPSRRRKKHERCSAHAPALPSSPASPL